MVNVHAALWRMALRLIKFFLNKKKNKDQKWVMRYSLCGILRWKWWIKIYLLTGACFHCFVSYNYGQCWSRPQSSSSEKLTTLTSWWTSPHLLIFVIAAPTLPRIRGFTPLRVCGEMCMLLCFLKNSPASLMGKMNWITQKEMQLPPPSRFLITEPWCKKLAFLMCWISKTQHKSFDLLAPIFTGCK